MWEARLPIEMPSSPSTVARPAAARRIVSRLRSPSARGRSYVVREHDGGLGTICIYQASSPEKIREHAARADIPATDIFDVVDTVIVRPDPVHVEA